MQKIILTIIVSWSLLTTTSSYARESVLVTQSSVIPAGAMQVSPEDFRILVAQAEAEKPASSKDPVLSEEEKKKAEEEKKKAEEKKPEPQPQQGDIIVPNIWVGASGSGDNEMAILIFAIIGTVVVLAWIPYMVVYLYKGLKHPEDFRYRSMLNVQGTYFVDTDEITRRGNLSGLKYTTFIEEKKLQEANIEQNRYYGLNVEVGKYHFRDEVRFTGARIGYDSAYWLVGPSFLFGNLNRKKDSWLFKLDLLGGTSFSRDVDLMLRAEFSINHKFDPGIILGVGYGGNYLSGQSGKGLVSYANDLSGHWLVNLGFLF